MSMIVMGIDPGAKGGIAWWMEGRQVEAVPIPDSMKDTFTVIRQASVGNVGKLAYIEKLTGFTGNGAGQTPSHTSFKLGKSNGILLGMLVSLGFVIHEVAPQTWQKTCNAGSRNKNKPKSHWKNHLKNIAGNLFPMAKVTLSTSDALLLLYHGLKHSDVVEYSRAKYKDGIYYDYHFEQEKAKESQ